MKPFFYVYRVGYGGPTVRHATVEDAEPEALRLAGQHPGTPFQILMCVGEVRTVTPQTFWMDGVDPESMALVVVPE